MKKDNMDILLENALRPNLEPSKEINEKILGSIGHRRNNSMMFKLARVAAVIIAITCVGSIGVYAANQIIKQGFVTEHSTEASEMFQFIKYEDKREVFGFQIHSFSTFDKVKKYDEADNAESAEKPYSIEVGKTKRTINLYAVASTKFEIAC